MPDFLAENNICGQTILQLVSRGNAIIAELLRLKDYIPQTYRLGSKEEVQKYGEIIMDFSYFKIEEAQNYKIENSELLQDLDEEFRDNHIEMINRFYLTFESIHTYITDLNHFLDELEEGLYIHQSLETIFADMEGKQLLCEALFLYGLMLLIIDTYIEGPIRERLLVSYYRYTPQRSDTQSQIDDVCRLLRDTGFHTAKKPNNYPEDYFRRVPLKPKYVDIVIGHLRSDDIYGQLSVYPLPKHRSTALAHQASMLYVCLFFSPNILHSQTAIMREIVDKYFPDNWVISIYMGFIVNLAESWECFKAAKMALNNTLETVNIKGYASSYGSSVLPLLKATNLKLKEGNITSDNLLKDVNNIINLLRDCNFTIRWLMLHTLLKPGKNDKSKKLKQLRELVITESRLESVQLFKLLLNTSQLELITREIYKNLLLEKDNQWSELKSESFKSLVELSEVFSGAKPLTRIPKNENLQNWFLEISKQVDSLCSQDAASSRKIVQLIQALEEVQEFHQLESNMQVVQFLSETRKFLHQMIRNMNIKEDVLITLQIIGDLSYAWELIDSFTPIMQFGIKKEPTLVIKLRAIFLKLSSALEVPLLRINQAHSEDLISVSQYYSSELEIYVRKVLQIIPKMMFEKMARVIEIQTCILKELPTRLDKDKLKDFAQLNERFEFAELTHSISVFSQGMRMMKSTLVGVICLDPKQLLEDGIRKELVLYISKALHTGLIFGQRVKVEELEGKLEAVGVIMDGYKRSFEYIQDYININGLKIWQEEVTRIINYNVEQECNGFLRNKIHTWESAFQSRYVPIPLYPSTDSFSENFIGRLAREIIKLTDPKQSVYLEQTSTWYDIKSHKPIFNKETIALVASAIEISGLVGLDRLFSFMIISNLQKLSGYLEMKNAKTNAWHNVLASIHKDMIGSENVNNPIKFYQNCVNRTTKIWNEFLDCILLVGQLQLLRNLIAFHLNKSCKFNAKNLESSLRSLNKALLLDIVNGECAPSEDIMSKLSHYFDYSGLNNPFNKIYITSKFDDNHYITIFVFAIAHFSKLFFLRQLGNANKRNADQIDGTAFTVAIHTLVKQFHNKLNESFIKLLSNYVVQLTRYSISIKNTELPLEVSLAMSFLETYTNYSESSRKCLKEEIPDEILHLQQTLVASAS
ncbi:WASH complex subunit strumpellin homolog-like Protein [Tribolium castaneum]|uniref:WASH complex subunit strumpellin homolog-like Protein n=1 Tax=Tribolium castaneum TaxID=7070 RepID=D6WDB2_TRICA|nr:WASH complex subunit strumpellin homolog-like Protein [Tribolium castaneum]